MSLNDWDLLQFGLPWYSNVELNLFINYTQSLSYRNIVGMAEQRPSQHTGGDNIHMLKAMRTIPRQLPKGFGPRILPPLGLRKRLTNFFCKRTESRYCRWLCGQHSLRWNYSSLPFRSTKIVPGNTWKMAMAVLQEVLIHKNREQGVSGCRPQFADPWPPGIPEIPNVRDRKSVV